MQQMRIRKDLRIRLQVRYKILEETPRSFIDKLKVKSQSSTGGLVNCVNLRKGARIMLTVNVGVSDCLMTGQLGTIDKFQKSLLGLLTLWKVIIYIKRLKDI